MSAPAAVDREGLLALVAADAPAHDRAAAFPERSLARLEAAGLLAATVPDPEGRRPAFGAELDLVREVARADLGLGRIVDGHLNAVERLAVQAPEALAREELARVAAGALRLGVWGADPGPGEGEPARLDELEAGGRAVSLHGTKVFCSGAGGLQRAWVLVRGPEDRAPARMAYVDLTAGCEVDEGWWRGAGMRGSASHRVTFRGARVLHVDPAPGALLAQPWFARDGVRTAASWVGGLEAGVDDALAQLAARPGPAGEVLELAAGRLLAGVRTCRALLADAAARLDVPAPEDPAGTSILLRDALAREVRATLDEAARAVGSRPFATGTRLERVTRDLTTYLLQHRLEPALARAGSAALDGRREA